MSKVSTIYDACLTTLATLFSTKTRIPNPYSLPDNHQPLLVNGYGLRVDSSTQVSGEFCNFVTDRTFTIIVTRELIKLDSKQDGFDTVIKNLLEDVYTIQKRFYNVDTLGLTNTIDNVVLASTSNVLEVNSGKFNFLAVEVPVIVTIREAL